MNRREKSHWRPAIRILPSMPLEILLHHRPPVVSLTRDGSEHFFTCLAGPHVEATIHEQYMGKNVYEIRDRFFLANTPTQAFEFLASYSFFLAARDGVKELTISWTEFQRWQQLLKLISIHGFPFWYDGSEGGAGPYFYPNLPLPEELRGFYSEPNYSENFPNTVLDDWLWGRATHLEISATSKRTMRLQPNREPAKCTVIVGSIVEAILATIYFNDVIGVTYEKCSRTDCDQIFEVTTNHERRFCSQKCAHTQGTRERRLATTLAKHDAAKKKAAKRTVKTTGRKTNG
jgi:hypothetical protein